MIKKTAHIVVRCTKEEKKNLLRYARTAKLKPSEYVRNILFGRSV